MFGAGAVTAASFGTVLDGIPAAIDLFESRPRGPATQETTTCNTNRRDPPQVAEIGTATGP